MRYCPKFAAPLLRLSGLAAATAVGLLAASTAAGAAAVSDPVIAPAASPNQSAAKTTAVPYSFSCDFSGYGGSTTTAGTATFTVPTAATAGDPATTTFKTTALPLTSAVAQKLASADTFSLDLTGLAATDSSGATPKIVVYPGVGSLATSGPAAILPIAAVDNVTFDRTGTGHITGPASFTITPMAGSTAMPAIKCANSAATTSDTVDVTAPASTPTPPTPTTIPAPSSGPGYRCVISITGIPQGTQSETVTTPIPMTLSESGVQKTGSTVLVTLSSGSSGLGAPYPLPATELVFSGALAVEGAQHAVIPLRRATAQVGKNTFTVAGSLHLTQPGADRVYLPGQFTFTVVGPYYPGTHTRVDFILACTATPGPQIGLRLNVTGQPVGGTAGGGTGGSTTATGAVPAGAPNTGGGPRPGSDLPMVLGGVALLLLGGGGIAFAARRRRVGQQPAA